MSHNAYSLSSLKLHTIQYFPTYNDLKGMQFEQRANIAQFSAKKGESSTPIEEQRLYYLFVFNVRYTLIAVQGSVSRVAESQRPYYNEDALSDN